MSFTSMLSQYVLKFLYNKRSWKDMWNGFVLHHIRYKKDSVCNYMYINKYWAEFQRC